MNMQEDPLTEDTVVLSSANQGFDLLNKLPAILRILGTGAVLIAMYSFLVKGWDSGNDIFRYLLMLGHTGALAVIGLASGHWLKEGKGARLLLTLSLASIPANFAILGAFIFSQTTPININAYPHYVAWSVENLTSALFVSGGAMFILVPVTLLGFTILARSMSRRLSLLFLLSNSILLIPVRDPHLIGLFVLGLTLVVITLNHKTSTNNHAAKTKEGIMALGLQLLPVAVLMGRSLWLYSTDLSLLTVLSITIFFILRQISLQLAPRNLLRGTLEGISVVPALFIAFLLTETLQVFTSMPHAFLFPVGALVSAAMIYDISRRNQLSPQLFRAIAVYGLVFSLTANLFSHPHFFISLTNIIIGLCTIFFGFKTKQRSIFIGGSVIVILDILQQIYELVIHFDLGSWASLAVLGITSIVIASVMEAQGRNIKILFATLNEKYKSWKS